MNPARKLIGGQVLEECKIWGMKRGRSPSGQISDGMDNGGCGLWSFDQTVRSPGGGGGGGGGALKFFLDVGVPLLVSK